MSEDVLFTKLTEICGSSNIVEEKSLLENYSKDLSFVEGKLPKYVVWVKKAKKIGEILKLANKIGFKVIPISSSSEIRHHGDTLPKKEDTVIINLSKMKKILNIDRKNRVIMLEPGITFGELLPKLRKKQVRITLPLLPSENKSVLTSALERVPITIPKYQWDTSDPLLCTEVFFGTGDLFRTGTAAGPGRIRQQKKTGQAQVNPMGPTQFSPFRIIQGAQGSIGIVSWATLKLELVPDVQKVFHLQSNNIQELLKIQHELIKYRLCDELLILNDLNLACIIGQDSTQILELSEKLLKWNLIYVLSGRGKLANDRINYLEGDINDILKELKLDNLTDKKVISETKLINALNSSTRYPWRLRLRGSYQDIFFLSALENIPDYVNIVEKHINQDLGVYIQAINQGTSYHCEFDVFYDIKDEKSLKSIKNKFLNISSELMDSGAFFNRPYGLWAKEVYKRHSQETIKALIKVKKIFDPNNVLNPGVLCFDS
ncbi:MAG: FAD-binding protein [Promethearchaeota archaeon]